MNRRRSDSRNQSPSCDYILKAILRTLTWRNWSLMTVLPDTLKTWCPQLPFCLPHSTLKVILINTKLCFIASNIFRYDVWVGWCTLGMRVRRLFQCSNVWGYAKTWRTNWLIKVQRHLKLGWEGIHRQMETQGFWFAFQISFESLFLQRTNVLESPSSVCWMVMRCLRGRPGDGWLGQHNLR